MWALYAMRFLVIFLFIIPSLAFSEKIQVKGFVKFGPEAMYFQQCNSEELWWLDSYSLKSRGWSRVQEALNAQPECSLETMPCSLQSVNIIGAASVTKGGKYGHLGMYTKSVLFTSVQLIQKSSGCGV